MMFVCKSESASFILSNSCCLNGSAQPCKFDGVSPLYQQTLEKILAFPEKEDVALRAIRYTGEPKNGIS